MVINHSLYRIDYIRVRMPHDIDGKLAAQEYYTLLIENICQNNGFKNDCYAFGRYTDTKQKIEVPYFECWGVASDAVYHTFNAFQLSQCTRLDIRKYLHDENVNFSLMHIFALNHNHARGTTRRIDSPYRNKKGGRDVGGTSIILGGEDSDIRLATYRRGHEQPAHELQIKGRPLYTLVKAALARELVADEQPKDLVRQYLIAELHEVTEEKYGISIAEIEEGKYPTQIVIEGPIVDETLQQIDWLYGTLPIEAQEAFIADKTEWRDPLEEQAYTIVAGTQEDARDAHSNMVEG